MNWISQIWLLFQALAAKTHPKGIKPKINKVSAWPRNRPDRTGPDRSSHTRTGPDRTHPVIFNTFLVVSDGVWSDDWDACWLQGVSHPWYEASVHFESGLLDQWQTVLKSNGDPNCPDVKSVKAALGIVFSWTAQFMNIYISFHVHILYEVSKSAESSLFLWEHISWHFPRFPDDLWSDVDAPNLRWLQWCFELSISQDPPRPHPDWWRNLTNFSECWLTYRTIGKPKEIGPLKKNNIKTFTNLRYWIFFGGGVP